MKFNMIINKENHNGNLYRYVIHLPQSFKPTRLGADFDKKTGVLTIFEDDEGCKVIPEYDRAGKRVQLSQKKWLPDLNTDRISQEVEWKDGQCTIQVCKPTVQIKIPQAEHHTLAYDAAFRQALQTVRKYVEQHDDVTLDVDADGVLHAYKTTVVEI